MDTPYLTERNKIGLTIFRHILFSILEILVNLLPCWIYLEKNHSQVLKILSEFKTWMNTFKQKQIPGRPISAWPTCPHFTFTLKASLLPLTGKSKWLLVPRDIKGILHMSSHLEGRVHVFSLSDIGTGRSNHRSKFLWQTNTKSRFLSKFVLFQP